MLEDLNIQEQLELEKWNLSVARKDMEHGVTEETRDRGYLDFVNTELRISRLKDRLVGNICSY